MEIKSIDILNGQDIDAILDELYDLDIEYGECEGYLIELDQIDGEYAW